MTRIDLRQRFRGWRSGGYTYARIGKSNADPIRVKTFAKPRHAALMGVIMANGNIISALMQGEDGTYEIAVHDGLEWTPLGQDLLRALMSDDECTLAELIGRPNSGDSHIMNKAKRVALAIVKGHDDGQDMVHKRCLELAQEAADEEWSGDIYAPEDAVDAAVRHGARPEDVLYELQGLGKMIGMNEEDLE